MYQITYFNANDDYFVKQFESKRTALLFLIQCVKNPNVVMSFMDGLNPTNEGRMFEGDITNIKFFLQHDVGLSSLDMVNLFKDGE